MTKHFFGMNFLNFFLLLFGHLCFSLAPIVKSNGNFSLFLFEFFFFWFLEIIVGNLFAFFAYDNQFLTVSPPSDNQIIHLKGKLFFTTLQFGDTEFIAQSFGDRNVFAIVFMEAMFAMTLSLNNINRKSDFSFINSNLLLSF